MVDFALGSFDPSNNMVQTVFFEMCRSSPHSDFDENESKTTFILSRLQTVVLYCSGSSLCTFKNLSSTQFRP